MKKLICLTILAGLTFFAFAQAPQGFNYQAVIRNSEGQLITEQAVTIRLTLQDQGGKANHYAELHFLATSPQGIVNLVVGSGIPILNNFIDIPWEEGEISLKVEVDPLGGSSFTLLGISQLYSVPYALHAQSASQFVADPDAGADEPLFVVRNSLDQIVFAVYEQGVRVYVDGDPTDEEKGNKSGFAIGGLTGFKDTGEDYFRVSRDYTHVLFDTEAKGNKSGFAIGGLTGLKDQNNDTVGSKNLVSKNSAGYMSITPENYFIGHESGQNITEGLYNSFMGYESGYSNTTGSNNSFIGYRTGFSNLAGNSNTFLGDSSGFGNTSGSGNLFVGKNSGIANTEGNYNSFIGYASGFNNSTGINNSFLGSFAGYNNTEGSYNTFVGDSSGYKNRTGSENSFYGDKSGFWNLGNSNTFIGHLAGYSNNFGDSSIFIGSKSGYSNTTGKSNVFIGSRAGFSNTGGKHNVFLGYHVGYLSTQKDKNIFIGYQTGYNNQGNENIFQGFKAGFNNTGFRNTFLGTMVGYNNEGDYNIFLGSYTGYFNTEGYNNILIGKEAGYKNEGGYDNIIIGFEAGYNNTSGSRNIFLGYKTGNNNTTGTYNTALGYQAFQAGTTYTNSTALGNGATIGASNQVRIGNSSVTSAWVQVAWSIGSDKRIKENINENVPGLDFIKLLRPVTFNYNISKQNEILGVVNDFECDSKYDIEQILYSGFIAQEVEMAAESIGYNFSGIDKSGSLMGLKYSSFTIPLVKAVQELNEKNEQQQKLIEFQHREIETLKSEIEAIKAIMVK
jgi:hypothetical protein